MLCSRDAGRQGKCVDVTGQVQLQAHRFPHPLARTGTLQWTHRSEAVTPPFRTFREESALDPVNPPDQTVIRSCRMGEDSAHAERSAVASATSTPSANSDPSPGPVVEAQEVQDFLVPGFNPSSAPSSPTQTLSRLGTKTLTSPTSSGGQVSAITVVALLDKLVAMIEAVQENQRRMEKRQAELEGFVRGVQGDVARLAKSNTSTANGVSKLLERSRKTGGYVKDVRERLDRQGNQVKRLEANHAHLLKRNHFKVLIFQVRG